MLSKEKAKKEEYLLEMEEVISNAKVSVAVANFGRPRSVL